MCLSRSDDLPERRQVSLLAEDPDGELDDEVPLVVPLAVPADVPVVPAVPDVLLEAEPDGSIRALFSV